LANLFNEINVSVHIFLPNIFDLDVSIVIEIGSAPLKKQLTPLL